MDKQQPATSNQQPATSNQQPATSNQQPATSSINTRIPAAIVAVLRELAKTHERSLNGEIVRALREYVERHQNHQDHQDHQNHQNEK